MSMTISGPAIFHSEFVLAFVVVAASYLEHTTGHM